MKHFCFLNLCLLEQWRKKRKMDHRNYFWIQLKNKTMDKVLYTKLQQSFCWFLKEKTNAFLSGTVFPILWATLLWPQKSFLTFLCCDNDSDSLLASASMDSGRVHSSASLIPANRKKFPKILRTFFLSTVMISKFCNDNWTRWEAFLPPSKRGKISPRKNGN